MQALRVCGHFRQFSSVSSSRLSPSVSAIAGDANVSPLAAGVPNGAAVPKAKNPICFGTRLRKSPFFQASLKYEVTDFTVYNKVLMPIKWGTQTPSQEYYNLVENVCLWDVSAQRQVEVKGPDAARLAQLLSARDLTRFKAGQGKYIICTDRNGIVINDPLVMKLSDDRFWFSIADRDFELWAQAHADARNLDVSVRELEVPVMAVQGPRSLALLGEVFGKDVVDDIKFFHFKKTVWHGVPTIICRSGWSPELGFEIYPIPAGDGVDKLNNATGSAMWDELVTKGQAHGIGFGTPNQPRRLEAGMISSCDYEATRLNALEMNQPRHLVNLDMEPDFIGKQALLKLRAQGVASSASELSELSKANPGAARLLVGIQLEGEPVETGMSETWDVHVKADGERGVATMGELVGQVTSCAYSPRVCLDIGLATIKASLCDAGTQLVVNTPDGPRHAKVVSLPFEGTEKPDHRSIAAPF